ncbi:MAG: hypothetical protein ABGW83_07935 [Flavobacteriaceae bacterium]
MSYYEGINQGDDYMCDRCEVAKLRADEFNGNIRDIVDSDDKMRYCDECRNYITLQTWTDKQGNKHTLRSERIING